MEERPVYSFIPKNLNATGGLFGGTVDTRRLIEGMIGIGISVLIYRFLGTFIRSPSLFYVCAFLGIALFAAGIAGGNGEPMSIFLMNFINYEHRRIFVTLRPPMPTFESKGKSRKEKDADERSTKEQIMSRLSLLKGPTKEERQQEKEEKRAKKEERKAKRAEKKSKKPKKPKQPKPKKQRKGRR